MRVYPFRDPQETRSWDMKRVNYAIHSLMYMIHHKNYGTIYSQGRDVHGPYQIYAFADGSLMNESKRRSRSVIYEDNQPTIRVANNESSIADAGRHIEVKNFKLGELVEDSTIVLKYIETQRQVADLLTKPLGKIAFERLRDDLTGYLAFNKPLENIHVKMCRIKMQCVNPKKRT